MKATETTTRSCKGCANFQWAGESKAAHATYEAYLRHKAEYDAAIKEAEPKGFWGHFFAALPSPPSLYPCPPYPARNPAHYGWCRLNPVAVEMGVNEWCSHYATPSNGGVGG